LKRNRHVLEIEKREGRERGDREGRIEKRTHGINASTEYSDSQVNWFFFPIDSSVAATSQILEVILVESIL
jgi:hypothetical protein